MSLSAAREVETTMNRTLLPVASLFLALSAPLLAAADQGEAQRYEVLTPFSDIKAGAARVQVHAPLDKVHQVVSDFGSYSVPISRFEKAKVDDATTKLDLELLIVPDFIIPVPGSLITGEVAYAAEKAVKGIRSRSEEINAH